MESVTNTSPLSISPKSMDIDIYVAQLTPLQQKAHQIAIDHLKTSFDIYRSNGFIEWKKSHKFI